MAAVNEVGRGSRRGGGVYRIEGATNATEKSKKIKSKSQTKIKVLKVNNANWHLPLDKPRKRIKSQKKTRKTEKRKMFFCGKPSRSPIENDSCSYFWVFFSIFDFWFSSFSDCDLRFDVAGDHWKSESIKVTKWLNFGVRHSRHWLWLPVACCMLHVARCPLTVSTWLGQLANTKKKVKSLATPEGKE